jgi:hypothetical protein
MPRQTCAVLICDEMEARDERSFRTTPRQAGAVGRDRRKVREEEMSYFI